MGLHVHLTQCFLHDNSCIRKYRIHPNSSELRPPCLLSRFFTRPLPPHWQHSFGELAVPTRLRVETMSEFTELAESHLFTLR